MILGAKGLALTCRQGQAISPGWIERRYEEKHREPQQSGEGDGDLDSIGHTPAGVGLADDLERIHMDGLAGPVSGIGASDAGPAVESPAWE